MITTLLLAAALQTTAAPAASTDVPRCSATVTDECVEGGGMARHVKHKAVHHKMQKAKKATTTTTTATK